MGTIVNRSRNIFIDSEQYHSNGDLVRIFLPNEAFSVFKDESMKFIVSSFEMQKKFYNINKHNNTFYAYNDPSFTEIKIPEGDYFQFGTTGNIAGSLCEAIFEGLHDASMAVNGGKALVQWAPRGWADAITECDNCLFSLLACLSRNPIVASY